MKAIEDENRRLKRIYPDLSMQAGSPWKKVIGPSQRPQVVEYAVARRGVSVSLACHLRGHSEICYRYSPLLSDENEEIADLLIGLTDARKTWGIWAVLRAFAQRQRLSLETQKGSPDLLRA